MRVICGCHKMIMAVGVRDRMRVNAATVKMRVDVLMRMRVMPYERVDDYEPSSRNHHDERAEVDPRQAFFQQKKRNKRPDERRDGVIGARFRGAKHILGAHIQEDAEPVGHEAENERGAMCMKPGIGSCFAHAMASAPNPENTPLRTTISYVLFDAMLRVQLFSNPQQTVAAMTSNELYENLKLSAPSNERRTLASVMSAIAVQRRFETVSRKTNSAISVVATISKLPSNEALADEPCRIPSMRKNGSCNVENDHADDIRQILARKRSGRPSVLSVEKRQPRDSNARAEIEKRGHRSRSDIPEQYL